jgi:predicted PurR-regulated permease PerM
MGILGLILGPVLFAILITVWREETGADHLIVSDSARMREDGILRQ